MEGLITPHVLRHAYATHSRESIDALRLLLGHSSIETTAGYLSFAVNELAECIQGLFDLSRVAFTSANSLFFSDEQSDGIGVTGIRFSSTVLEIKIYSGEHRHPKRSKTVNAHFKFGTVGEQFVHRGTGLVILRDEPFCIFLFFEEFPYRFTINLASDDGQKSIGDTIAFGYLD